jgi:hypothetical protein
VIGSGREVAIFDKQFDIDIIDIPCPDTYFSVELSGSPS